MFVVQRSDDIDGSDVDSRSIVASFESVVVVLHRYELKPTCFLLLSERN
jgi:hypothetical protein